MGEWEQIALNTIINLIGGGTPKTSIPEFWNGDIPWLSVADFNTSQKFVYDAEKKITKLGLEKSSTTLLKPGDIIISARGTVGVVAMLGRTMAFNQSCYGVRANEKSTNGYVYYFLKYAVNDFKQVSHGGVFDTITRDTFKEITILLPPLPEQKAIAEVLSSLDDKIDLLHRQNKTLEALAETLFRQWFVEEASEDWEEVSLGFFAENPRVSVNNPFKGPRFNENDILFLDRNRTFQIRSGTYNTTRFDRLHGSDITPDSKNPMRLVALTVQTEDTKRGIIYGQQY